MLDDAHHEGEETLTLRLSKASRSQVADDGRLIRDVCPAADSESLSAVVAFPASILTASRATRRRPFSDALSGILPLKQMGRYSAAGTFGSCFPDVYTKMIGVVWCRRVYR